LEEVFQSKSCPNPPPKYGGKPMLNRERKAEIIAEMKGNIDKARAVFLTNLIGIPSNDANEIRKTVRDAQGWTLHYKKHFNR
jgi:ribosomal protein L10